MALIFYFSSIFFLSPNYMLILKICVEVFSGTFKARMLKLCIHMDNELFCAIENLTPSSFFPFICPFFYLLRLNLCHSFLRNCAS